MKKEPYIQLKFVFVGESCSGKTSLFNRMSSNKFQPENNFLSPDYKFSIIKHEEKTLKITFWDTVAQQKYQLIKPRYYENANVLFVCFDLSVKLSTSNIQLWLNEIEKHMADSVFIAIIGCKEDVAGESSSELILKKISQRYRYEYFSTSSWTGKGVLELLEISIQSCLNQTSRSAQDKRNQRTSILPVSNTISATSILKYHQHDEQEIESNEKSNQGSQKSHHQQQSRYQASSKKQKTVTSMNKTPSSNRTQTISNSNFQNIEPSVNQLSLKNTPSNVIKSKQTVPLSSIKNTHPSIRSPSQSSTGSKALQYPQSD